MILTRMLFKDWETVGMVFMGDHKRPDIRGLGGEGQEEHQNIGVPVKEDSRMNG